MLFKSPEELVVTDETINFSKYFNRIKNNFLWIVLLTLTFSVLAFLKSPLSTDSYSATATIMIDAKPPKPISIQNFPSYDPTEKEFYATQYALLRSNAIAEKVINQLDLINNPSFMGVKKESSTSLKGKLKQWLIDFKQSDDDDSVQISEAANQTPADIKALQIFAKNLLISPIDETQLVMITYTSKNPELAAQIANAVGEAYINYYIDIGNESNKKAAVWLTSRLEEIKKQLKDSEDRLTTFLAEEKLINTSSIDELANNELLNLTNRLSAVKDKRVQTQSLYATLRGSRHLSYSQIDAINEISNHPQIRDITNAETEAETMVSEMSKRYGPRHEKMQEATSQLASIRARKDVMLNRLVQGIRKELESYRHQEREIEAEIASKKEEFQDLTVKKVQYQALKQDVDTNMRLLQVFLDRQKETLATDNYKDAIAHFTDYALKAYPSGPNLKKNVMLAGIAGFGLSLCILFAMQFFDTTVQSSKEFERYFSLFSLGNLPYIKRRGNKKAAIDAMALTGNDKHAFLDNVRNVRSALNLAMVDGQRTVMITSALAKEGKTTLATNLAHSLAQSEKVVLIQADMHHASTAVSTKPGLSELLSNKVAVADLLNTSPQQALTVITAGGSTMDPQELLSSPRLASLLSELAQRFDKIIIDAPTSLVTSDAFILAKHTDVNLLAVAANTTKRNDIEQVLHKFGAYNIHVDGVVINKVC